MGTSPDNEGWAVISELIEKAWTHGRRLTEAIIREVVATSEKRRFSINSDGTHIRANYGHSVPVDLGLPETMPPECLCHGTATRNLAGIRQHGIQPGKRNYVHLYVDETNARSVGIRHGRPVVIMVQSGKMYRDGHCFIRSESGIWLTEHVPPEYLRYPGNDDKYEKS